MGRKWSLLVLSLALLAELAAGASLDWWEDASLYQIYPRSFQDSNGDGVGDLVGITSRLEYLKEIRITGTWLSPIFESPMSDFGYDISNFTKIDPIFGTLNDFDAMVSKAKKLGIKIILDFVPNHSSDECEWFTNSVDRKRGFVDFYIWDDGKIDPRNASNRPPPSNWVSIFGGPAWTWHPKRQQFYLHQFQSKQPDLNFHSARVKSTMLDVLQFWLDRGVSGFRIDAVPHIYETPPTDGVWPDEPLTGWTNDPNSYDFLDHVHTKDRYETVGLLYEWRKFLDNYQLQNGGETRILLAEAYSPIEVIDNYYGNGTHFGVHMPFNFGMMWLNGYSTAKDIENSANYWMDVMWKKHKTANWVMGNHDNPRIVDRLGKHKVDLYNIILAGLPGVTVTYYGEEIGMANVKTECTEISCDERDAERTPFQWNDGIAAGFSANPQPWLPVADDYKRVNVKGERGIARSHLNVFKGIQALKHSAAFKAFKTNPDSWRYGALNEQIFYILRYVHNEAYLILANVGNKVETYSFASSFFPMAEMQNWQYHLATGHSPHRNGEWIVLDDIELLPFESVVLKWTK